MKNYRVNAVLPTGVKLPLAHLDGTHHCPDGSSAQVIAAVDDCGLVLLVEARDEDHAYDVAEIACREETGFQDWIMDDVCLALSEEDDNVVDLNEGRWACDF